MKTTTLIMDPRTSVLSAALSATPSTASSKYIESPEILPTAVEVVTAEDACVLLKNRISTEVEEVWAIALGPRKLALAMRMIFRGTVDSCLVHPREIFRFACLANASSLIVAHSHPSGDLLASEQDILFTRQLVRAARILEIPVNDHLILTKNGFSSFAREGWCSF